MLSGKPRFIRISQTKFANSSQTIQPYQMSSLTRFEKDLTIDSEDFYQDTARDLIGALYDANPVDTGRSRSSWHAVRNGAEGPEAESDGQSSYLSKREVIDRADQEINQATLRDQIELTNAIPYLPRLEEGHSQQAPNGFIRLTLDTV